MREESHLEAMRAAVRGDRERAAARRRAELAPPPSPPPQPEARLEHRPAVARPEPAPPRRRSLVERVADFLRR